MRKSSAKKAKSLAAGALRASRAASLDARLTAIMHGTPICIAEGGKVVLKDPETMGPWRRRKSRPLKPG